MDVETIQKMLREKINVIEIQVEDDSYRHRNHKQAKGSGGHFKLLIVSNDFEQMKLVDRHRKIYEALAMNQTAGIHAMAIQAWTEKEWKEKNVAAS